MTDKPKAITAHLEQLQASVYITESLIEVIIACGARPEHSTLMLKMAESAQMILQEIGRGLDSVELAKVTS
jgi:hypothetical protein